ncbi:hypothetical protein IU500_12560 [Nocardia terpenica]|uniref:hypothetical protein n=1 Tax=Nocardia terpenica TaxID=455432 RepID=UPI00189509EA|nr:hypothetical protein [Nocardia terpenica]MBF6062990.1 hypothetical protein [Nocardia terpenica]MBF6104875.1 hypothetical protein [Nocardia terpenica]MBF6112688.1 hypothetical protein [Nocardia terpenica]MBF6118603.1 hypothetical protein [Nocardia terpenica]MBF6155082.1 hypothetical protein [Nocardia terpenica]
MGVVVMPVVCVGSPLSKPGPLPGSTPFLAVMTGNNPEETPILRLSLGLYKLWMMHLEAAGGAARAPMLDELSDGMDLFCFLLDREAAACLAEGPFPRPDAQLSQYPYSIRVTALARTCAVVNYRDHHGRTPTGPAIKNSLQAALALDKLVEAVNQGAVKLTTVERTAQSEAHP